MAFVGLKVSGSAPNRRVDSWPPPPPPALRPMRKHGPDSGTVRRGRGERRSGQVARSRGLDAIGQPQTRPPSGKGKGKGAVHPVSSAVGGEGGEGGRFNWPPLDMQIALGGRIPPRGQGTDRQAVFGGFPGAVDDNPDDRRKRTRATDGLAESKRKRGGLALLVKGEG